MACKNAVKWVFRLARNHSWQSPFRFDRDWAFLDKTGRARLLIASGGEITVTRGYSWDGCTPKVCLVDVMVGTPDGVVHARTGHPKTYYASLIHDALYQFLPQGLPMCRAQADRSFLAIMEESDFAPRYLYYAAVRAVGWLTLPITRRMRGTFGGRAMDLDAAASEYPRGGQQGDDADQAFGGTPVR